MNESETHREGSRIQIDSRKCGIAPTAPRRTTNLVLQLCASPAHANCDDEANSTMLYSGLFDLQWWAYPLVALG